MLCLADNDIILKLVACDLLDEALVALNVAESDVRVLATLKFRLRRPGTQWLNKYGQPVIDRALAFVKRIETIAEVDVNEQARLITVREIDEGEATLFAASNKLTEYFIATGDKRCLVALASAENCKQTVNRLRNKVICLEQIVLRMIAQHGFEAVKAKAILALGCDTALAAVFGAGEEATQTNVLEALNHYVQRLREQTGRLLVE